MLKKLKMDQAGVSLANMEFENVKEISLKPAPSRNMTSTLKLFHSSSVLKVILPTGLDQAKNVQLN